VSAFIGPNLSLVDWGDVSEIVLMADPRVIAVPVQECGEPLVAVQGLAVSEHKADLGADRTFLRSGAARRLAEAARLLPEGLRLLFVEGWRAPLVQRHYFESYRDTLRRDGIAPDDLDRLAGRYVSPPALAPHTAGAAVDLTLCTPDGAELDMGTRVNASPEESAGACYTAATNLGPEAAANRDTLSRAMTAAGFVNYPTEWWHWSYGDRYWALMTGASAAIYGPATRP
jgi:zinc D-Ala-D-Ala dipeptidase